MPNIAYFISGHGYGHGVRAGTLINAMPESWNVFIYSSLPEEFFKRELKKNFRMRHIELDCGAIQKDNQSVEKEQSLAAYDNINKNRGALLQKCRHFFDTDKIELALVDIAPLALTAAKNRGIPAIALSNFSWCDIYEPYLKTFPEYSGLLLEMESDYQNASESLLMTPGMEGKGLPLKTSLPLLAKGIKGNRLEYAKALGLPEDKHWALMYLGHLGSGNFNWQRLEKYEDWIFTSLYPLNPSAKNFRPLNLPSHLSYSGLLSCCQAVFGKLGYGLVGELVCHGIPFLFTQRNGFSESEILKNYLNKFQFSREIAQRDLENLELTGYLDWALQLEISTREVHFGPDSYLEKIKDYFD